MSDTRNVRNQNRLSKVPVAIWVAIIGAIGVVLAAIFSWFGPRPLEDAFAELTAQAIMRIETAATAAIQTSIATAYTPTRGISATLSTTILPTATLTSTIDLPSLTPTVTLIASLSTNPSATHTITATNSTTTIPSLIPSPSATVMQPASTPLPNNTTQFGQYPCSGTIVGVSGLLNQVHIQPNINTPFRPPVARGSNISVLESAIIDGVRWYQISYNEIRGWITSDYVNTQMNCP